MVHFYESKIAAYFRFSPKDIASGTVCGVLAPRARNVVVASAVAQRGG